MTIEVKRKLNYGREDFYPLSDLAIAICEILKRKTLTKKQLEVLANYNIDVEVQDDSD